MLDWSRISASPRALSWHRVRCNATMQKRPLLNLALKRQQILSTDQDFKRGRATFHPAARSWSGFREFWMKVDRSKRDTLFCDKIWDKAEYIRDRVIQEPSSWLVFPFYRASNLSKRSDPSEGRFRWDQFERVFTDL